MKWFQEGLKKIWHSSIYCTRLIQFSGLDYSRWYYFYGFYLALQIMLLLLNASLLHGEQSNDFIWLGNHGPSSDSYASVLSKPKWLRYCTVSVHCLMFFPGQTKARKLLLLASFFFMIRCSGGTTYFISRLPKVPTICFVLNYSRALQYFAAMLVVFLTYSSSLRFSVL